ncbi:MAG: hypothetical protein NTX03_03480 [Bacteroidetes bacterium]|nr:hypothetical protein [Bacteroidota bacterium]
MKKIIILLLILFLSGLAILIALSPYKTDKRFAYKLIENTVVINACADSVFSFLGKSTNAHKWSVYVDHITPLNKDSFEDGKVGCRRRCFQKENEKDGQEWDELTTEVIPNKKRQLKIYNLQRFFITADNLATEQIYEPLDSGRCKLTFTLFCIDKEPSLWDYLKINFAAYPIKNIFTKNMNNIKRIVEGAK